MISTALKNELYKVNVNNSAMLSLTVAMFLDSFSYFISYILLQLMFLALLGKFL